MLPTIIKTSLYLLFVWLLGICYGFVLISSAAGQNNAVGLFQPGESLLYQLHSAILLNEKGGSLKNVGFYIDGQVSTQIIWGNSDERIFKVELKSPKLNIKSRKAPSPDGFIQHSSKLDKFPSKPFFLLWNKGKIDKILLPKNEQTALSNLKKGIASFFQFQLLDVITNETDASGFCQSSYSSISPTKFIKTKSSCLSINFPYLRNEDIILGTIVDSTRITTYELNDEISNIKLIRSKESHKMYLSVREEIGNEVEVDQTLTLVEHKLKSDIIMKGNSAEQVVDDLLMKDEIYTQESLLTERELINFEDNNNFFATVSEFRDALNSKHLGNLLSAKAFLRLVAVARKSTKEDVQKTLDFKKNQKILSQICDVLGYVQNQDIHDVVMKKLHFDKEENLELNERYLWALSISSQSNPNIILDLLKRHKKSDNYPEKVKETLTLTIAAMARKLNPSNKMRKNAEEAILNGLDYARNQTIEESFIYLRALKNLKSPSTIPILIQVIKDGNIKEAVLAFRAIKSLESHHWTEEVKKIAIRTFFQIDRKHDSSSRTLAADIILESNPNRKILQNLIGYLKYNDSNPEIKEYINQRITMISQEDTNFRNEVYNIVSKDPTLNNYLVLSPNGLSTALKRSFSRSDSSNGSLLTIQEINNKIVKRGIVDIVIEKNRESSQILSLGIFSGGLGSFVSSNSEGEDEIATAGMELTVLGTQIRPFVFFNGQGELMGHVWSGTASEKTTAYQALSLLQDHLEFLRLGSGFIAELDVKGALSFDLSGKIEISLWNRNAESLVEKAAGILAVGAIKIDTSFVRSQVEFSTSIEPKLNLQTDIDFSANMNLCMRLAQPDSIFRHNIFKIERIPGSKHKLRIAKYKKVLVPGKTYSLNRKNNEMCSAMFK